MAQAGLHAYIAYSLREIIPQKKWFLISFILGALIPDVDIIITSAYSLFAPIEKSIILTHRTFTHSIFSYIIIYLLFLIIYEVTKNKKYLLFGNGIFAGLLSHLILDIFLWFDAVHIFWPLPTESLDIWYFLNDIKPLYKKIFLALEFVFFRLFAWQIIEVIIKHPFSNGKYLKNLSIYMKTQTLFLIVFCLSSYFLKMESTYLVFSILYIPSLLFLIYFTYKSKNSFNEIYLEKKIKLDENITYKKSSIHNIE